MSIYSVMQTQTSTVILPERTVMLEWFYQIRWSMKKFIEQHAIILNPLVISHNWPTWKSTKLM